MRPEKSLFQGFDGQLFPRWRVPFTFHQTRVPIHVYFFGTASGVWEREKEENLFWALDGRLFRAGGYGSIPLPSVHLLPTTGRSALLRSMALFDWFRRTTPFQLALERGLQNGKLDEEIRELGDLEIKNR